MATAWVLLGLFIFWSGDIILDVRDAGIEAARIQEVRNRLEVLQDAWRDMNRPGNDVLVDYNHVAQSAAHGIFRQQYLQALDALRSVHSENYLELKFFPAIEALWDSADGLTAEILNLAEHREAMRLGSEKRSEVHAAETRAAQRMATMDQTFQRGMDLIGNAIRSINERMDGLHAKQRNHSHALYLLLTITLLATASTIELSRRLMRDFNERWRREERLRQAAMVFDHTGEGVFVTDPRGILLSANAAMAKMAGVGVTLLAGRFLNEFAHPSAGAIDSVWQVVREEGTWQGELTIHGRTGRRTLWTHLNAVRNPLGEVTSCVGVTRDISELKSSQQLKDAFIASVSHELRTPLTAMNGAIGLVVGRGKNFSEEKRLDLLRVALKNGRRLARLIDDILDIERMESGVLPLNRQLLDLSAVVRESVLLNQSYASEYGVVYKVDCVSTLVRVHADRTRLIQVISNLLSNAAKFSPPGAVVSVCLERLQDTARLSVTDRGPGVDPAFRAQIFRKFAQSDSSDTSRQNGSGLGLAISKQLIEQQGGRIGFVSEPHVNTTFYIELPLWKKS